MSEHVDWSKRTIDLCRKLRQPRPSAYGFAAFLVWFAGDNERARGLSTEGLASASDPDDPETAYCWVGLVASSCRPLQPYAEYQTKTDRKIPASRPLAAGRRAGPGLPTAPRVSRLP